MHSSTTSGRVALGHAHHVLASRVDRGTRAEALGERETLGHAVGDDHVTRAEVAAPQGRGQADGPGAEYQYRLAGKQARRVDRVQADGERLDQCAACEVDARRQAQRLVAADAHVLGIGPALLAETRVANLRTAIAATRLTGDAMPAGTVGQRGDPFADRETAHRAADLGDLAGELVPHHRAGRQRRHAAAIAVDFGHVQVRAANAAASYGEDDVIRAGRRRGDLLDGERSPGTLENRGAHGRAQVDITTVLSKSSGEVRCFSKNARVRSFAVSADGAS